LGLVAARTAQIENATEIGVGCGAKTQTVQDWLSVLERNLVLHRLPPWHSNLNKRLIKSHKLTS
jgi:predicted AAA+ superfamily ATPase